jgi:hypothetical protein
MAILWAVLLNLALVLFIINGVIWFRAKRRPRESDERAMFGSVSTSFGGGDFLSAALVVVVNIAGGQAANAFAGTGLDTAEELGDVVSHPRINWPLAWLIQAAQVGASWVTIAWRNAKFLDWKWSGVAALLIPVTWFVVALVLTVVVNL